MFGKIHAVVFLMFYVRQLLRSKQAFFCGGRLNTSYILTYSSRLPDYSSRFSCLHSRRIVRVHIGIGRLFELQSKKPLYKIIKHCFYLDLCFTIFDDS